MDILIKKLWELKELTAQLNDDICHKYSVETNFMPIAALNMINQHVVLALELISHYRNISPKPTIVPFENHLSQNRELAQRLFSLLESCFVGSMSSIESCAKKGIRQVPGKFKKLGQGKVYWTNITQRSRAVGLMSADDVAVWDHFRKLRNYLVHNNGEAEESFSFRLPDGLIWESRKGGRSRVTLMHIPKSLEWMVTSYACWCDALMRCWTDEFDYMPRYTRAYGAHTESTKVIPLWGVDTWGYSGTWSWRHQFSDIV